MFSFKYTKEVVTFALTSQGLYLFTFWILDAYHIMSFG